ncbi:MAG TPA: hypothetical protein VJ853_15480 [Thermoanaerobaculia bacterium]|nr:hypothetical protein [Thermoanaerobaculia bacterium]
MKRALIVCLFIAIPAFAQEYGRASAGAIDLTPKSSNAFDGSFSLSSSRSLGATFGGSLVKDRVWFFGSADRVQPMIRTTAMPTSTTDLVQFWRRRGRSTHGRCRKIFCRCIRRRCSRRAAS